MTMILGTAFLVASVLGLIIASRFVFGFISRLEGYSLSEEIIVKNNSAVGIRYALFTLAVVVSFLSIMHPSGLGLKEDLNIVGQYGLLAMALLVVSRWINDKCILYSFNNNREVITEKNSAVAMVEGATYLATALVMSGALAGWEGGFLVSLAWFGIGQVFLILLGLTYRACTTRGSVDAAIDGHNHACALSMGGFLISGGIVLGAAVSGPFNGWTQDLKAVALYTLVWLIVIIVTRFVANYLILPSSEIQEEVMFDGNAGAGAIEAALFLAVTLFYTKVW